MARSARRNYVRDGRGRFASTPGGGAAKKPRTTFRQRQAVSLARGRKQTGRLGSATREAKARLAASRKKLTPNASPQQKAAVTRAKRMAAALAGERRIKTVAPAGVIRGAAARGVKKAEGARVRNVRGDGMSKGRPGQLARALARAEANRQRLGAAKEPSRKKEDGYAVNTEAAALYSGRRRSGSRAANSMPVSLSFDAGKKVVARRMAALRGGPAATAKPTPKGALKGGKGGSRKRVKGGEGAPKALPPAPAKPKPIRPASKVVAPGRRRKVKGPSRRTLGTIAKPKGLKPGALAERKGKSTTRPSIPGFTPKDFERRAQRAFYNVKNTKVRDRALELYKRFMDTDKTPAQVQKELTTGPSYSTVKNKPKSTRKRLSKGERDHRDMLSLAKYLFR